MVPSKAAYEQAGNVLKVEGKLDFSEETTLRKNGMQLLGAGSGYAVLDLSKVTYISSSCLGELLVLNDEAKKKQRKLKVVVPRNLLYVYDIMGLRSIIETAVAE